MSHLFEIITTRQTICWERNFDFLPMAGENGAGMRGWPGATKILEFQHFSLKGAPIKSDAGHFWFYATF